MECKLTLQAYRTVAEQMARKDGKKRKVVKTDKCFDIILERTESRFKTVYISENGK